MKNGTYNINVFMPEEVYNLIERKRYTLMYTKHAIYRARSNRRGQGIIHLKNYIDLTNCDIVEIEVKDSAWTKILVKRNYNKRFNLLLVLKPLENSSSALVVPTVWLNRVDDNHSTLNKDRVINNA